MNYRDYIKAILFDYDGTLINFDYTVSDYTRKALDELKDKDYILGLSSGRPCFLALKCFIDEFGEYPLDYIFGCNGAEMMNVRENRIDILYPVKAEDVVHIGKILDHPNITLGIYDGQTFLVNKEVSNPIIIEWMNKRNLTPVLFDYSKNTKDRSKILALSDPKDKDVVKPFLESADLGNCNGFFSSAICYEIAAKGISKAKSVEELAKVLDCDKKQIMTFGDMDNDLDMLKVSTGVAMGNSTKEVLDAIPLKTEAVDKKGIYEFLNKNGLI